MPIYEYQCRACNHRSEAMQRISDPPLTECGECGGELKKLISVPAFQFKGSGWYVTDYAGKGGKPDGEGKDGDKAEAKDKGDGGESKADGAEAKSSPSKSGDSGGGSTDSGDSGGSGGTKVAGTKTERILSDS